MKVTLVAIGEQTFASYLENSVTAYAEDNVNSDRWDESEAFERSKAAHDLLLPEGLATKASHLFNIASVEHDESVGHVWVKIEENIESKSAFIVDLEIYESYRRNGFAKVALELIERFVAELGASRLGLHVFHSNSEAIELYNSVGFHTVSHNMQK